MQNAQWQEDASAAPIGFFSANVPNTGGTTVLTASYPAQASDCGKLLVFNSPSAVTLTLPASIPFEKWQISIANIGSGALSVTPGTLNLDGSSSAVDLGQLQSMTVLTDGAAYYSSRGLGGLSNPMTTEGDLIVAGASGVPTRLAANTGGYVLTSNGPGVAPSWQPSSGGGGGGFLPYGTLSPSVSPAPSSLTWVNQGLATATSVTGLTLSTPGSTSQDINALVTAVPSTPYKFTVGMIATAIGSGVILGGICLLDSSGKIVVLNVAWSSGWEIAFQKYTASTFNGTYATEPIAGLALVFLQMEDDGVNLTARVSGDGTNFVQLGSSISRTDWLSSPAQIGVNINASGGAGAASMFFPYWKMG
jgi:hypothetical protein